jgi:dephospho-CoA kinase
MLVIGLTGGIGSGKSTVADLFAAIGVPVIDTDRISREIVEPGTETLQTIVQHFGPEVLLPDGHLDRRRLRERIFHEPADRAWLEQLLHPRIGDEMQRQIVDLQDEYVIVVVPLLFESGFDALVDRILVVDAPEEQQIARVTSRDSATPDQVISVLGAQMDRQERLRRADEVIVNDADIKALRGEVAALDARYRALARGTDQS